jgi:hypothetical protein
MGKSPVAQAFNLLFDRLQTCLTKKIPANCVSPICITGGKTVSVDTERALTVL